MKILFIPGLALLFFIGCTRNSSSPAVNQTPNGTSGTYSVTAAAYPVISGVSASTAGQATATINWTTDVGSTSQVNYGSSKSYGASVQQPALVTSHSVRLNGLSPGKVYHFQVTSIASGMASTSADQTFTPQGFIYSTAILTPLVFAKGKITFLPVSRVK